VPLPNESRDLVSVHSFYVAILEADLGYQVPLPPEVIQARAGSEQTTKDCFCPSALAWNARSRNLSTHGARSAVCDQGQ
jgi:hypothetical protein